MADSYAVLCWGSRSVTLSRNTGLFITKDGIEGWYSTPDSKVDLTEYASGDGAAWPGEGLVLYSARTVTVHVAAGGRRGGAGLVALQTALNQAAHSCCTLRVVDGGVDTYVTGYATVAWDSERLPGGATGILTIVCPDPRRYGTTPHRAYLSPGASAGALGWHEGAPHGLLWPLSYGGGGAGANVATLRNDGTSTAYPVITASGDMDGLTLTDAATGAQLTYDAHVGTPVKFDCLAHSASVSGVDASRLLSARGFPSVPAGGETTLALTAEGTGTVEVAWRDTYI
jgi:hypothetical protein